MDELTPTGTVAADGSDIDRRNRGAFVFSRREQAAYLGIAGIIAVVSAFVFTSTLVVDEPTERAQVLRSWALAALPVAPLILFASLRPMRHPHQATRRFWRWWLAGDVAWIGSAASIGFGLDRSASGIPPLAFAFGCLVLPLWGWGGVEMLREKSGSRQIGVDLVDTAVAVVTIAAAGAYAVITPILGSDQTTVAVPFALLLVGAPAGVYLTIANFTRLPAGHRSPQAIAIAISAVIYLDIGYSMVNAVREFTLPLTPAILLRLLAGMLLLGLPLYAHAGAVPGLDRLPIAHQARRPSPLLLLPVGILPALAFLSWQQRHDHPNRMAFVMVVLVVVLALGAIRSLVANRESVHLYGELDATARALEHRASHDDLTGLVNRRRFVEIAGDATARQRRSQEPLALLYIDLDRFKPVNDTLGHTAGDDVLREVGQRLLTAVRTTDAVARLGGDEFVVLCENTGEVGKVEEIAGRIVHDLAEPIVTSAGIAEIGASVGVLYIATPHPASIDELLHQADEAMYDAKNAGRGRRVTRSLSPDTPVSREA